MQIIDNLGFNRCTMPLYVVMDIFRKRILEAVYTLLFKTY